MLNRFKAIIRPLVNSIREINKLPFLEKFLAKKTQGKRFSDFWVKLLPSVYSYKPGSIRKVDREGIKYELDISDYLPYVLYFGLEDEPKKMLYQHIKEGMFVFDIGTNIGETLLNFAKRNTTGKNFGFEPVPFIYERAKKNIGLNNNFQNIYLHNIALSNQAGSLFFDLPPNRNFGSINMTVTKGRQSEEVKAITFDNFIKIHNIPKVDFIKIDVEGFENFVLEGARDTILKFKPVLFVEVDDNFLRRNNSTASQLVLAIETFGYEIFNAETSRPVDHRMKFEDAHLDILCFPRN